MGDTKVAPFSTGLQRKTGFLHISTGALEGNCTFYRTTASTESHLSLQKDYSHHLIELLPTPWFGSHVVVAVFLPFAGPYLNMSPITKDTVAVIQFALWVNKVRNS